MAWDTEGTRRRLKEAATAEFAERGPDGTTMASIAERAGSSIKVAIGVRLRSADVDEAEESLTPPALHSPRSGAQYGRTPDAQCRWLCWQ